MPNHPTRSSAKRKAQSADEDESSSPAASRPQRKKQKQQQADHEDPVSSTAGNKSSAPASALTKHLMGLYNELQSATDETYQFALYMEILQLEDVS